MRWSTLVLPVALFYSLSSVNAIPHEVDEKRHWLHRRQGLIPSSRISDLVTPIPSPSEVPQGEPSPVVSPTPPPPDTPSPSPRSSSSTPTSTPPPLTPLPSPQSSEPSSSSSSSSDSSSSSSSSSLSSPSSNTRSSILSSTSSTITNRPNGQSSTSYRRFSSTRELPSDTVSAEGNVQTGTGSGSSFLKNKAAMGTVFAIVGIVGVAIIVGAMFFVTKRARQRRDEDELDTYFEKLPASNTAGNQNPGGNEYGLGPSATDLTAPANDQAYMSRDVHYGITNQYPNYNGFEYPPDRGSVVDRPVSYAPGTAYAAAMSRGGPYHYEGQAEDPNATPNHPFADPNNRRY